MVWKLEVEAVERDRGARAEAVRDAPLLSSNCLDTDDLVDADRTAWGAV